MSSFVLFFLGLVSLLIPSCASPRSEKSIYDIAKHHTLLYPTWSDRPLIILDGGHGGRDQGAKVKGAIEKRLTLLTALLTKKHLEEMGYRVLMTRSRDVYLPLARRVSIANKAQAALFISIHYNSSRNKRAQGIEVYYASGKEKWRVHASQRLANCVLYEVADETDAHPRGIKKGNFHVIRETEMPAILVEGGFLTNPKECIRLRTRSYLDQIALGVAKGIDKYLKNVLGAS